jgi:hypothetical protein
MSLAPKKIFLLPVFVDFFKPFLIFWLIRTGETTECLKINICGAKNRAPGLYFLGASRNLAGSVTLKNLFYLSSYNTSYVNLSIWKGLAHSRLFVMSYGKL